MKVHPIRAYLRQTRLASYVRRHPLLYRSAVRIWRLASSAFASPTTLLLLPFLLGVFVMGAVSKRRAKQSAANQERGEIVMLAVSEVFRDPRVEREARALAAAGYQVKILYPDVFSGSYHLAPLDWGPRIAFAPLPEHIGYYVARFPYLLGFGYLRRALAEKPFAFHAHDLSTSLVALAAARFHNVHCVCDFHEWYSENVTWVEREHRYVPHSRIVRWIFATAERIVLRRASSVVTVCDSIADELRRQSRRRCEIVVIRNIPYLDSPSRGNPSVSLRSHLGLARDAFIVLYQGGTGPTRLLEPVIEAIQLVPGAVLVIRGPGIEHYGDHYCALARSLGIADRVFCLKPVLPNDVVHAARGADAGIWSLPNMCRNFYYALPNKLFEYLAAGLPVLIANYPEVARVVTRYEVGLTFEPYSPESIAAAIDALACNPGLQARMRANTLTALEDMRASKEWGKLVLLYDELRTDWEPRMAQSADIVGFPRTLAVRPSDQFDRAASDPLREHTAARSALQRRADRQSS
jgi:glycosyltransferase involved in cell wall biosynthesis